MNRAVRLLASCSLSVASFFAMSGCAGYQLGSVKPTQYKGIHRIYVPTFKNDTLEPRSAVIVTNSVIKYFQQDGTYQMSSKEDADAILKATISRIERRQLRAARSDTLKTTEMKLFIVVEWSLIDAKTGERISYTTVRDLDETNVETTSDLRQRPGRIVGQTIQFLDPNFQLSERVALPLAAEDVAKQLVGQLANGW